MPRSEKGNVKLHGDLKLLLEKRRENGIFGIRNKSRGTEPEEEGAIKV